MTPTNKLKPCPFCGGQPTKRTFDVKIRFGREHTHEHSVQVCCPDCSAKGPYIFADYDISRPKTCIHAFLMATQAWNERVI
jgi:hypothetical protein